MRRLIRTLATLGLLSLGIWGWKREEGFKPRVKVPVTRYHGYELNREAINRAKAFTVLISNEGFGSVGRGTGVLIDPTHVLTCAHMVESSQDDMWIYPYPIGIVVKGKPILVNSGVDLAVLELSSAVVIAHYAVFQDMHYDGEPITIVGNILGSMKWFVSFGIISGDFQGYLLTDGLIHGGNSGGPWINERGEVVAITSWGLQNRKDEELGVSGGVSASTIHEFLRTWKSPSIGQILRMILGGNSIKKGDK